MRPQAPKMIRDAGNMEDVRTPDAATESKPGPRVRRHPLRLSHLIAR